MALVPGLRLVLLANTAGLPDAQGTIATIIAAYAAVVLATVSSAAVGALLASRRPRHPVGWLLFGVGLAVPLSLLVEWSTKYGLLGRAGSLPAAEHLVGFAVRGFTVIWLACAGFVLLLTPTGRLPSPRWRWWARVTAAAPVVVVLASVVQPDPLAPDWYGNPLAVRHCFVAKSPEGSRQLRGGETAVLAASSCELRLGVSQGPVMVSRSSIPPIDHLAR